MKTKTCNLFERGLCVSPVNPQPLANFFDAKGVKDGKASRCKACMKAIAHERRLKIGGGQLRVPKRPKAVPVAEKSCSKFKSGKCAHPFNPQPIENFRPQKGRTNGRSICLSCEQQYMSEHRQEALKRTRKWHRENKEYKKDTMLKKLYGISLQEYGQLLLVQDGCCAICKVHHTAFKGPLAVDHCHTAGKVRGLLCHNCNRGLGFFKEDIDRFLRAVEYIKAHKPE